MSEQPTPADLTAILAKHHWGDDTALVGHHAVQCGCGWTASDSDIYALRQRHDQHRAERITAAGFGPVRAVEAERDARDVGLTTRERHALAACWSDADGNHKAAQWDEVLWHVEHILAARAEHAEAREKALRESVEALADEWETNAGDQSEAWRVFGPQTVSVPFAVGALRALLATSPDQQCANYQPPLTCLTAPSSESGRCAHCRDTSPDREGSDQ